MKNGSAVMTNVKPGDLAAARACDAQQEVPDSDPAALEIPRNGGHFEDGNVPDARTTDDAFLDGQVQVLQLKSGYRAGSDAVMLAAAAPLESVPLESAPLESVSVKVGLGAREPQGCARVLDAGAGVGVAALCVAARCDSAAVTLVETEPVLCTLAARNMRRNGFRARATIIAGDLTGPAADLMAKGLKLESYDHVLANPPFFDCQRGTAAADPLRAGARAMAPGGLERWARFLAACARPGGSVTMIHKADALEGVLQALLRRFGALRVLPIHSRAGEPAQRILVQGIKGSRAPLQILPGFIVHEQNNSFTARATSVLRHGAALSMTKND